MSERLEEILKEESGKSKIQRLRERKKSIPVVIFLLYFSAFFGNNHLEEGFLFVSLVLMYYIFFIIFSPLSPSEFLKPVPIFRWSSWKVIIGSLLLFIPMIILIFKQTFYLVVISMFAVWVFVSAIPIACQIFWSRTLAKIKNEVRKTLADSLLVYLPVTLFLIVILVSTAFLLLSPVTNFYFFLIVLVIVIVTFFVAIEIPFCIGTKRDKEIKIRNLGQTQKNLINEFHDSKRTNQKFDKLLDIWLKGKEISRIKSEPLHPYIRSWKIFVTVFYLIIIPIVGIFIFEFLRGFI